LCVEKQLHCGFKIYPLNAIPMLHIRQ
jgi:hypothetical protein